MVYACVNHQFLRFLMLFKRLKALKKYDSKTYHLIICLPTNHELREKCITKIPSNLYPSKICIFKIKCLPYSKLV